jgi:hypothetical protein
MILGCLFTGELGEGRQLKGLGRCQGMNGLT